MTTLIDFVERKLITYKLKSGDAFKGYIALFNHTMQLK